MIPRTEARNIQGFTIIEVLVAMLLFAIVTLVILAPLTGLFGLTQRSTQQVTATNLAQQAIEEIRGEWLVSGQYGRACVNTLPSGVTPPTAQDKDIDGNVLKDSSGTPYPPYPLTVGSCTSAVLTPRQPAIRAVTVSATVSGSSSTLNLEIARP